MLFKCPEGVPCGSAGKESACSVGDLDSIPGLGRSPREGKGYPHQYSGLENSMDCIVHGVAELDTTEQLSLSLSNAQKWKCWTYDSSIFNFLRHLRTVFHTGCTNLHSHQQCTRASCPPYPCPQLLSLVFFVLSTLTSVRRYFIVVLICIFLMIGDAENIFMYLLAVCMFFSEEYLFRSSTPF